MAPTAHQARIAKTKALSTGKQPKARVVRYLKKQESQLVEGPRNVLLLKGIRCSDHMSSVLKDLRSIKAPNAKLLSKNNVIVPFEDTSSIEFLMTKNDSSLFALASHNKKRPNNLIIGRTFDRQVLDMVELGLSKYKSLHEYSGAPKKRIGSKPMMLFQGDAWHLDSNMVKLQNLLIDFYRGEPIKKLALSGGLDHLINFTVGLDGIIYMRTYYCKMKKNPNGGKTPVPFLTPSGPDMDFKVRRTQYASPELWKVAMKQPQQNKPKKTKNQSTNLFGETIGRLHLPRQNLDQVQGRRAKALRIAGKEEALEEKAATEKELGQEKDAMDMEFEQTHGFVPNQKKRNK